MCIYHAEEDIVQIATKDILVYKTVRRSFSSQFGETFHSEYTPKMRDDEYGEHYSTLGRDIEYTIGSYRRSSLDTTPGIMAYRKLRDSAHPFEPVLQLRIPKGTRYRVGRRDGWRAEVDVIACERIQVVKEIT